MPRKKKDKSESPEEVKLNRLLRNYQRGVNDMESRQNRKNGWKDTIKAYLNVLPTKWPFQAKVTEPLIRTTILEKNGRLLNSKLKGKLVPREHGDLIKARVNNALLDFQWDRAETGGSMLEKTAMADLYARLFGAAFAWVYWDAEKDCNEMKIIDPRDVLLDPRLQHIKGAGDDNWVQIREWTTREALIEQGYDVPVLEEVSSDQKDGLFEAIVKDIRGLDSSTGPDNSVLEVVHQLQNKKTVTFLPKHKIVLKEKANKQGKIQVAMLRYYPLPEDIYGESEVEPVINLARSVNWILSGFTEEGNRMMHPPVIVAENGVQRKTIVHVPGAIWIANRPELINVPNWGGGIIQSFNNTYPMLKAAFGTAMGAQSLGVSNVQGYQTDKTATEVKELSQQQNSRDQYNQLYLGEFLKSVMMMWVANNKQYLLDDPTKNNYVLRIVGQEQMKEFQKMGLDHYDVSAEAMDVMRVASDQYTQQYGAKMPDSMMQAMMKEGQQPRFPVVTNPEANPEDYNVVPKLEMMDNQEEANLHIEKGDFEGVFDFIPDIVSMSLGANIQQKQGRLEAYTLATKPESQQMLSADGYRLKGKELLSTIFQDNNFNDANSYFEKIQQPVPGTEAGAGLNPLAGQPGLPAAPGMAPAPVPMAAPGAQPVPFNG